MWLFEEYNIDIGYVVMGMAAVILIEFIILIVTLAKNSSMKKKYKQFMNGEDGKNLEKAILDKFSFLDKLDVDVRKINIQIDDINKRLVTAYQKIGIVKYDAFREIGGKLSFVLVLLTSENNGIIINCMHSSKEGCYTYSKTVVKGRTSVILSEEERQALDYAINDGRVREEEEIIVNNK